MQKVNLDLNELKQQIINCMENVTELDENQNLIELGLNSLKIMKLASTWRKLGIKVSFSTLMKNPSLKFWHQLIWQQLVDDADAKNQMSSTKVLQNESNKEIQPQGISYASAFPLTDVQYAYWIGRQEHQTLGSVGCHAYLEFEGENIVLEQLKNAWQQLVKYHPMLHARFLEDGTQEIMREVYDASIIIHDLRASDEQTRNQQLEQIRNRLSHRKLDVEKGQCAGLEISLLPNGKHRLHFDLDLLVADLQSMKIILRDLVHLYEGKRLPKGPSQWSFENYLIAYQEESSTLEAAREYWLNRIKTLPMGPELPLIKKLEEIKQVRINRHMFKLEKKQWEQLKEKAAIYKVTPAMVLLTAYATILERWSATADFLINIPLFNRKEEAEDIEDVVADFTTLLLLEVHGKDATTFQNFLEAIANQFYQDLNYSSYSGVKVQREMTKLHPGQMDIAPVVFACNLGTPLLEESFKQHLGKFHYMVSQTPQVWLDFQTYEEEEGLMLAWDVVEELFPANMINEMFNAFEMLLHQLAECEWNQSVDVLTKSQKEKREEYLKIEAPQPHYLHTAFFEQARKQPDHSALIDSQVNKTVTYKELSESALSIADALSAQGIKNEPIAITLPRGIQQIQAIYGVLAAQNYYVPVSIGQPYKRRQLIHEKVGIHYVITNEETAAKIQWPDQIKVLTLEMLLEAGKAHKASATTYLKTLEAAMHKDPEGEKRNKLNIAYIIMTSGSTGEPKGVEMSHTSAWNTIATINEMYEINQEDTAIGISAIDFDLSVYDIFGILGAGGCLVCIPEEEKKNAFYWKELMLRYQITVWNSVPTLLDMLLLAQEEEHTHALPLRIVMLSGDWINMDLPERLKKLARRCRFIALGGATEAAIWSNYCEVTLPLPKEWKSIPYGMPLKNQCYNVVDEKGRMCPNWVKGELLIGGAGVAKGYRGDAELTRKKFTYENQIRWYHTGDMGRFWADGTIEFLGRKDYQVKVGGHRIELGEIETALEAQKGIKQAAVTVLGEERHLAAYIVLNKQEEDDIQKQWIRNEEELDYEWRSYKEQFVKAQASVDVKIDQELTRYFKECIAQGILATLKKLGWTEGAIVHLQAWMIKAHILPKYKTVLQRWINQLCELGYINKGKETDAFVFVKSESQVVVPYSMGLNISKLEGIKIYINDLVQYLPGILQGEKSAATIFYQEAPELAPMSVLKQLPQYDKTTQAYMEQVHRIIEGQKTKKWNIVEIGGQALDVTYKILKENETQIESYIYLVPSQYFLAEAQTRFKEFSFVHIDVIGKEKIKNHEYSHECDLLLAFHTLHQTHHIRSSLKQYTSYLKPGAYMIFEEIMENQPLQEISSALLEEGFIHYQDERSQTQRPLFNDEEWTNYLCDTGFRKMEAIAVSKWKAEKIIIFIAQCASKIKYLDEECLRQRLSQYIPDYMIPKIMIELDALPVTANGKIDRKQLASYSHKLQRRNRGNQVLTLTEKQIKKLWQVLFDKEDIMINDNYFELGGDSLTATKLISWIRQEEAVEVSIATIFENPTIVQLAKVIDTLRKEKQVLEGNYRKLPNRKTDITHRYEPFPLTDVQYAYWIGRSGLYELGQVGTHCYFELDMVECCFEKLNQAWQTLIQEHDMMRAMILADGRQCILKTVPDYEIKQIQVEGESEKVEETLLKVRAEMSHQVLATDTWPLFEIRATHHSRNQTRIHVSFDNLILDGWSMFHVLEEWQRLYKGEKANITHIDFSFRDYVLALEEIKKGKWYKEDQAYWLARVDEFKMAPQLPLIQLPEQIKQQHFARQEAFIAKDNWEQLKHKAKKVGITPSVLLITAYAETLRLWSKNGDFTLNLTQFNRLPIHPKVEELVGDFTTLTLLEINHSGTQSFYERAQKIQHQLLQDLEHGYFSGVEMQRALTAHNNNHVVNMPIVFTSGLGVEQCNEGSWVGKLVYNISQTPQVWLDHQVVERDGALCLSWDYVEELFDANMMATMFTTYKDLLNALANDEMLWNKESKSLVSATLSTNRLMANKTEGIVSEETLDGLFLKVLPNVAHKKAIISEEKQLSYEALGQYAAGICKTIKAYGIKAQEAIAIYMDKCWEQITSVYGVLMAGDIYLPLDVKNPIERIEKIIEDSQVKVILTTDRFYKEASQFKNVNVINVDEIAPMEIADIPTKSINRPNDLAYIIYTSGSTGIPKGVAIEHRGAINTILDINERYDINTSDTVLALSNLNFDLSVYDIFGLLSVGGTLVMPQEKHLRNPQQWLEQIQKYHVTVWNTVPAFMQMLIAYIKRDSSLNVNTLKQVLLSGDWIPVTLPGEIKHFFKGVKVSGLGGATEASIWSNTFDIPDDIPEKDWKSIPYGKPLTNQRYYVLNSDLMDCPDGVAGTLYIGGIGLAREYYHDEIKTNEKFIVHQEKGERLYCTGDMGRYLPDGNIEFLGREDAQVKINGYRVELGEIEAVIRRHFNVKEVAVVVAQNHGGTFTAAFIVSDNIAYESKEMKAKLKQLLPEYMVPQVISFVSQLKLSSNGKVDRKVLVDMANGLLEQEQAQKQIIEAENSKQQELLDIWKEILGYMQLSIDDHFFEIGGNSLQAIHLINAINAKYSCELGIDKLFEYPTVKALSDYLKEA